jgi:hypothetical protein
MNPGAQIGINAAVTFGTAFVAALSNGYSWKESLAAGMLALTGNQLGLYQKPPKK